MALRIASPPGTSPTWDVAGAVSDDRDGESEERPVRATEVEQHAVVPGDRDRLDADTVGVREVMMTD
jgi:hypothetical protein